MNGIEDFIDQLVATSEGVQLACHAVRNDWKPDEPPVTTLFAALGVRIAEDFGVSRNEANRHIFSLIEQAMASGDQKLVTAVATGLIEALVTRAVRIEGLWEEISSLLGPRSRQHAEAWLST